MLVGIDWPSKRLDQPLVLLVRDKGGGTNRSRMYIPVKDRELDLAKAKQLLAEAGYSHGFKTEFLEYAGYTLDYQKVVDTVKEDLSILYLAKSVIPVAHRDYVKGHAFGMGTWFGYYGGGMKKAWFDK